MKLTILFLTLTLASCSIVSPVYQFYAHKNAVPNFGTEYAEIPSNAPVKTKVYDQSYASISNSAASTLAAHRSKINSPGITAAVAIDGKLIWAGASGWADIARQKPMDIDSQFRIGSTSKALNATLLAKLVANNDLSLDTPISEFPSGRKNALWQDITPRQLASHSSGIPHYKDNTDWLGLYHTMSLQRSFDDVSEAVELFDSSDVLFKPGDQFSYSSLGTVLLSSVMQDAAQTSYQLAMQEAVLEPLNLTQTLADEKSASDKLVTFYLRDEEKSNSVTPWREVDLSHRLAGGGFVSTSVDLVKLGLGFLNEDFIEPNIRDQFWTPQKLNNGKVNPQNYAIGWRVRESDFGEKFGSLFHANHGGVSRGAQSWLMVIPEHKMAVAVNMNAKTDHFWDFGSVSFELVQLFLAFKQSQGAAVVNTL